MTKQYMREIKVLIQTQNKMWKIFQNIEQLLNIKDIMWVIFKGQMTFKMQISMVCLSHA